MTSSPYVVNVTHEFQRLKKLAESSIGQISEEAFLQSLASDENSVAIIVKHMAGNMLSRWSDFLTTDGEKENRNRDSEFLIDSADNKTELMKLWEKGWSCLFGTLAELSDKDLNATIYIRGEAHLVIEAINRQLTHYAYHVCQIVLLAKHLAGDDWQPLSVARGKSEQYRQNPSSYLDKPES